MFFSNGVIEYEMYPTFEKYVVFFLGNPGMIDGSLNVFECTLQALHYDHCGAGPHLQQMDARKGWLAA